MSTDLMLLALADGVSYAALLFMVSLGLTLIFGVMGIVNVAHGALYAFGGYTASYLTLLVASHEPSTFTLFACLVGAALLVGVVLGTVLETGLLRRVQLRDPVQQLLMTFAAFMVLEDVQRLIWGTQPYSAPDIIGRLGTVNFFNVTYTVYQLIVIPLVAVFSYAGLLLFLHFTSLGKQVVAVTHHREMATALGIHAKRIGWLTFVLGACLGALGGAMAAPTTSMVPGAGADMIVLSFAVVATAGMGQISGALLAALLIGLARSLAVYLAPEWEVAVPYLIMVMVLLIRPHGLFSVAQARRI
jgi:branched-chain amino acid transport system permease protein